MFHVTAASFTDLQKRVRSSKGFERGLKMGYGAKNYYCRGTLQVRRLGLEFIERFHWSV
jgi:hypothetical protein